MPRHVEHAKFWDKIARKYAAAPIKDQAGYDHTITRTRSFLNCSMRVYEIGCGTGKTALLLAPSAGHLVASDVSSEMIAIAREKAVQCACQNVDFIVSASENTPGQESSFDVVLAFNLLHLVTDRHATLASVYRMLKPGGLFISKTPCVSEMNPLIRFAIPVVQLIGKAPFVSFFSAEELVNDLSNAGFRIEERARHGTVGKDIREFVVARKADLPGTDAV